MAKQNKAGFATSLSGEPTKEAIDAQDVLVEEQEAKEAQGKNNDETPKVTLSLDEIDALLEKKLAEKLQSQKAETPQELVVAKNATAKDQNFDDIPELRNWIAKPRTYILVDKSSPAYQEIRSRHKDLSPLLYLNKETNEQFSLFYSQTQISFFKELHKGDSKVTHIWVKDGNLQTRAEDVKLQKFLAIHPDNVANGGHLFEEYDPSKEAKIEIDQEDLLFDAQKLCRELKFSQQDAVARLMCSNYSENWEPAELKRALLNAVKKEPERFINLANDKSLEIKGVAKTAVSQGMLLYRNRKFFNEDEEFLCELTAKDQDEWAVIANYLLSAQGNTLYEYLKHKIS